MKLSRNRIKTVDNCKVSTLIICAHLLESNALIEYYIY